jgi:ribonuclease BN (tRNA processing enzyme)
MKLTFLGTGAVNAIKNRNPASLLLKADNKQILIDCGYGCLTQMRDENIDFKKLDSVFITHLHPDHSSDLFPIIITIYCLGDADKTKARKRPFIVYGPKSLPAWHKQLKKYQWSENDVPFKIDMKVFKKEKKFDNLKVSAMPVDHSKTKPSLTYKFEHGGKTFVYSGDINWTENIRDFIEFCKDVDLLIIENGRPIGWKGKEHLEPFQISQIARDANPKKIVVVHLTDINSPAEVKDAITEFYDGEVIVARDGMGMEV